MSRHIRAEAEMLLSLADALDAAGGSLPRSLEDMTAWDLVTALAPNDIRFTYNKTEVLK